MAVKVGELYGELKLDKKPFDQGLDQTENKARGWASRVGSSIGGAATALLKWGTVGATVAGGGAYLLANRASDLNETITKTNVVFGENADEVLAWGRDAATSMGMSQNAALGARATLGNLFVSMGVGSQATSDMSQDMVELAGDLASFNNMDPTEVLEKLRAGLVGEAEPLRQLGVNISAAATEAKAMELGLGAVGRELTAAEKAQANYALIMEQTTTAQGDFARTSEGMANQQRIAAATFEDTMAAVGQAIVPIFEALLPQLTAGLQGFAAWATENAPTIQAVFETLFATIGTIISVLFTDILPVLVTAFQTAWPTISAIVQTAAGVIGTVIDFIRTNVVPPFMAVFNAVAGWFSDNMPAISSTVQSMGEYVGAVFRVIAAVIKAVWPVVEAVASVLFPAIGAAASVMVKVLGTVFNTAGVILNEVAGAVEGFGELFGKVFKGIKTIAVTVWSTVSSAMKGGINLVIGMVNGVIGFLNDIRVPIPRVEIPGTDIGIGGGYFDPFNIGRIPYLAKGVRGFGGGWAVVGERGPELVNLPRGADVFSNTESAGMFGGRLEVVLRDPDRALERGGYSQSDVERALGQVLRHAITGARQAGARV